MDNSFQVFFSEIINVFVYPLNDKIIESLHVLTKTLDYNIKWNKSSNTDKDENKHDTWYTIYYTDLSNNIENMDFKHYVKLIIRAR